MIGAKLPIYNSFQQKIAFEDRLGAVPRALKQYYGQLPRNTHHYGGWYTMTEENWP